MIGIFPSPLPRPLSSPTITWRVEEEEGGAKFSFFGYHADRKI